MPDDPAHDLSDRDSPPDAALAALWLAELGQVVPEGRGRPRWARDVRPDLDAPVVAPDATRL